MPTASPSPLLEAPVAQQQAIACRLARRGYTGGRWGQEVGQVCPCNALGPSACASFLAYRPTSARSPITVNRPSPPPSQSTTTARGPSSPQRGRSSCWCRCEMDKALHAVSASFWELLERSGQRGLIQRWGGGDAEDVLLGRESRALLPWAPRGDREDEDERGCTRRCVRARERVHHGVR
ncbi:hypothetical protein BJV78DRAFT_104973 [Lactifluus subvellereus]|nr:hypothetical protein BJV78DRAFT_104973 [Lactifluus subvellereus]